MMRDRRRNEDMRLRGFLSGTVIQSEARLLTHKPPASLEQALLLYSSFQYNYLSILGVVLETARSERDPIPLISSRGA